MTEYTLTSPKWEGEIRLKFHDNGFLAAAESPEVIDRKSAEFMAAHFPCHEAVLDWYQEHTGVKITRISIDTTFETFWELYGKKSGSKELARQYWDGDKNTITRRPVTLTDRQAIMGLAKRYASRYQGAKKEFQPLATSFLHQRIWEAELENTTRRSEFNLLNLFTKPKK